MKGRVFDQIIKATIFLTAPKVRTPEVTNRELVEAKHVSYWYLTDNTSKKIWSLVGASSDEESTVGSTLNDEVLAVGVLLLYQELSSSNEIVKHGLLFLLGAGMMPVLAVLPTSTNTGDDKHTA